jgi:S1-C subfamily serine protease
MMGQQMGQLEQGVQQQNPNQEAPELPKLQLPQNRPPANNNPPPMQVDPPQAPAGGGSTNLKSSYGAVFGDASGAVRVVDVQANTAAAKAGLRTGDLVTKINGRAVESGDDVQAALAQIRPGQQYRIELNRKGEPLSLTATR